MDGSHGRRKKKGWARYEDVPPFRRQEGGKGVQTSGVAGREAHAPRGLGEFGVGEDRRERSPSSSLPVRHSRRQRNSVQTTPLHPSRSLYLALILLPAVCAPPICHCGLVSYHLIVDVPVSVFPYTCSACSLARRTRASNSATAVRRPPREERPATICTHPPGASDFPIAS